MTTFIAILHVLVALMLIFLVLIQDSKGGAMGGMLGGGGNANSLLGATGTTSFLVKLTRYVAVVFALTCIGLTIMSSQNSKSVVEGYMPPAASQNEQAVETAPAETASPENSKKDDSSGKNK